MGGWPPGMEAMASMDFGGMGSFGSSPLVGSALPFTDIASQACQLAPALEREVHHISTRIQKLERSRGQISKDISDMLSETRELKKKVGIDEARKQATPVASASLHKGAIEALTALEQESDAGPPGLARRASRTKTAPASASLPRVPEDTPLVGKSQTEKIPPPPGLMLPVPDSLAVQTKEVDGLEAVRVEWRIDNVKAKFKDCIGRPLVSPQFEAAGLAELRLMVSPNLGIDVSGLTMREHKSRYEARIAEGPLAGALKFKVVTNFGDSKLVIRFNLFVGDVLQGPLEHNFADHIIHGADFNHNWLDQMKNGSLVVGVEMLAVQGDSPAVAAIKAAAKVAG